MTDFVLAERTPHSVVQICEAVLAVLDKTKPTDATETRYWVLATLVEAWTGLGDETKSQEYLNRALALDPPPSQWMIESTQEQLKKLRGLLAASPLKKGLNPTQAASP